MADTQVLGTCAPACGFKSRLPHTSLGNFPTTIKPDSITEVPQGAYVVQSETCTVNDMALTSQQHFIIQERSLGDFMSSRPTFGAASSNVVPLPSSAPFAHIIENRPTALPSVNESFVDAAVCTLDGGRIPMLDARRVFGWNAKTNLAIAMEGECLIVSVSSTPTTHSLDDSGRFMLPKWSRELLGSSNRVWVMSSYVMEAPVVTISAVESVASALQHYRERNI